MNMAAKMRERRGRIIVMMRILVKEIYMCSTNLHFDRSIQGQSMAANPLYPSISAARASPK